MSDVVLSTTESVTTVTVVDDIVQVAVTTNPVTVTTQTAGVQGASYNFGDPIYVTVRNATGATLTKGTIVYTSGAQGNHTLVQKANASGDATSARTLGWVSADIANNSDGFVVVEGYLDGIDTDHIAEGSQLYLSTVAGEFTATKPQAPVHLVYVGVVTKSNPGNGRVLVKVQNGYELEELHDVKITSPVNNQVLTYDSATDLWVNATNPADGVTSITATAPLTGGTITSTGSIGLDQTALSITKSQVSDFTSGTVTSASTAQQAGTAVYSVNAGTAVYATTSGTAVFATNASTAVTISGSITQSQVTNLTTDLAGKANLAGGNAFTGNQDVTGALYVAGATATRIQGEFVGASGQSVPYLAVKNSGNTIVFQIASSNSLAVPFGAASVGTSSILAQLGVVNSTAAQVGAVIRGAASQSANLLEIQNSAGSILTRVSSGGGIFTGQNSGFGGRVTVGSETVQGAARFVALSTGTTDVAVAVRGFAGQTANLQEWQNSAGTILARVSSSGQIVSTTAMVASGDVVSTGGTVKAFNGLSSMGAENLGGSWFATKQNAAAANPGANIGKLYFRDGTNAGTLKLVVRAGASGAETTILDNIPQ